MTKLLNVHQAKTHLSEVLADIEKSGAVYRICRNGEPIADLVPHRKRDRLKAHPVWSKISVRFDPTEELSAEEWPESEG
ncbi:MAG: type II toxin-antitoxin system Phd/YefM family antitoxin [Myxococcota bacterium]